jgi:VCBS repeat protein
VFFDYDNDGRPDLFVAAARGGDRLFHNTGGRFEDVTAAAHVPPGRWGSMAVAADYDRDGFLDLYVVRMGDQETTTPRPNYAATNGVPNTLLRNLGDGTFTDVTEAAGVGDTGWGMAAAWGDYDGDGWPDLYVANEFGRNVLYHNEGNGRFRERAEAAGVVDGGAGMGVAWGDYDGDGRLDLFVSNMHANSAWALFHPDFPAPIPWPYRVLGLFTTGVRERSDEIIHRLTRGSSLYRNQGDGTFTDVSDTAGVRDGQWGWAAEFLDYDNDGRLDLYAVNGFITGAIPDDV